jgi:hypothetical protein
MIGALTNSCPAVVVFQSLGNVRFGNMSLAKLIDGDARATIIAAGKAKFFILGSYRFAQRASALSFSGIVFAMNNI